MNTQAIIDATIYSLGISLSTALISGAAGILAAWLVSRTEFPGRRMVAGLLSVPYALPAYLLGMAWVVLGNPTVGLLKDLLPGTGSYGFWGITLVEASVAFAFPFLELRAGFERLDPALEEAARMSGASPGRVFRDVSFPLLWPSLVNGICMAFLYTISSFGVPALLGLPVRQFTLTTLIYSQLKIGGAAGLATGLQLSLLLLALAIVVLLFSAYLTRLQRKRGGAIAGAKSSRASRVDLGAWKLPAAGTVWGLLGLTVALPWFALGISALAPVAGKYAPSGWTLKNIERVLSLPDFQSALVHSILLATLVATLVVVGGFILGFFAVRKRKAWAQLTIEFLGVPFATPGTVLAIVIIYSATVLGGFGLETNYPLLLMAIAYGLKYAAVGARSMVAAYQQVDPALEEAARVSGARTRELLTTIWMPLLRKTLGGAWLLAMLPMLTELTMSVLLTGPGAATLGTVLFELQEYHDQPSAAALAWMLLTVAVIVGVATQKREETP